MATRQPARRHGRAAAARRCGYPNELPGVSSGVGPARVRSARAAWAWRLAAAVADWRREFRSAAVAFLPTAGCPTGRSARRDTAHRPEWPCPVRHGRSRRASAPARRLHARGRWPATVALPGSRIPDRSFRAEPFRPAIGHGRAIVRARRSTSRRNWGPHRQGLRAIHDRATPTRRACWVRRAAPPPHRPRRCRGARPSGRGSPTGFAGRRVPALPAGDGFPGATRRGPGSPVGGSRAARPICRAASGAARITPGLPTRRGFCDRLAECFHSLTSRLPFARSDADARARARRKKAKTAA